MSYEFTGRVLHVGKTDPVSDKFKKRDLVVATEGQRYEQQPKFQFSQGACDLLNDVRVGDRVTVTFDLSGKKVKRKDGSEDWFTNLDAWKIEVLNRPQGQDKTRMFDNVQDASSSVVASQQSQDDIDDIVPF